MSDFTLWLPILDDPPVYCITSGWLQRSGFELSLRMAAGRPFHLLVSASWDVASIVPDLAAFHMRVTSMHPGVDVTFMPQTAADAALLRDVGLKALHVHRNALTDDAAFHPDHSAPKRFAAVHNANLAPFKRHALAWSVRRIALITYDVMADRDTSELDGYEDIAWSNRDAAGYPHWIEQDEVARIVNQAHCGLMVSELEGGNGASTEYLFCGVPLITTLSRGGRHAMYDMASVTIVPPERRAVAAAVEAAARRSVDAEEIRARVMARALPHRRRLIDWLSAVSGRDLYSEAGTRLWLPRFRHRLRQVVDRQTGLVPALPPGLAHDARETAA
ncbi:MAG: hypothetical protein P4M07_19490 [Xanthobacteraceae bacterium]|nr:hypothetical protein [Xanthobacteraceae bacterium]